MKTVPGHLRGKCVKKSPTLAMSATATEQEIEELKVDLGLRSTNTVILKADPIQSQFNYIRVQRPGNIHGCYGSENSVGELQPGLIHTINEIFLDTYVQKIQSGAEVKKSIWLFRNENDIADVYDDLCERQS
jgi:hypothetical protein